MCDACVKEMPRGEFGHFARANEKRRASLQGVEDFLAQLDGHVADGNGVGADPGFRADTLRHPKSMMNEPVEYAPCSSGLQRDGISAANLAQHLGLAYYH